MDLTTAIQIYAAVYMAAAKQFVTARMSGEWMWTMPIEDWRETTREQLEAHATASAAWASLGYLPGEAAPLIAQGVTPERAAEMDKVAGDVVGSPDERAAKEIDRLVDSGALVDPARVTWREDPDDPTHIIVDVRPE